MFSSSQLFSLLNLYSALFVTERLNYNELTLPVSSEEHWRELLKPSSGRQSVVVNWLPGSALWAFLPQTGCSIRLLGKECISEWMLFERPIIVYMEINVMEIGFEMYTCLKRTISNISIQNSLAWNELQSVVIVEISIIPNVNLGMNILFIFFIWKTFFSLEVNSIPWSLLNGLSFNLFFFLRKMTTHFNQSSYKIRLLLNKM